MAFDFKNRPGPHNNGCINVGSEYNEPPGFSGGVNGYQGFSGMNSASSNSSYQVFSDLSNGVSYNGDPWGNAGMMGATKNIRKVQRVPKVHRGSFPWGLIITIASIVAVCAAIWYFRDAISYFLAQVLAWIVVVLVIVLLIRLIFRPRRRGRW